MQATIYKDDNFKTVGLKVVHADVTLYSWGATCDQFYYTKTINADPHMAEILDLIRYERMRQYYEWDFAREVHETNTDPRNMAKRKDKNDTATFIEINTELLQELEKRINDIITKIAG